MKLKQPLTILIISGLLVLALVTTYLILSREPSQRTATLPGTSQTIVADELVFLDLDQSGVENVVKSYDGVITTAVPQTQTFAVKFPVSSIQELVEISDKLKEQGFKVTYNPVIP